MQLELFQLHSLGSILNTRWQQEITDLEFLENAKVTSIEAMIPTAQLG